MDASDDNAIKMLPFSRGQNPFLDRERCLLCNCERTDTAEPESVSPGIVKMKLKIKLKNGTSKIIIL